MEREEGSAKNDNDNIAQRGRCILKHRGGGRTEEEGTNEIKVST